MEVFAVFARWSQLVANLVLLGSYSYLAVAGAKKELFSNCWVLRLERLFPLLASIVLIGLVGVLATTTGEATGIESNTWNPAAWIKIVQHTKMGHMWVIRAISALFLLGATLFLVWKRERVRWHYILGSCVAAVPLIVSTLVSHAASDENSLFYVPVYVTHILMAGVWFGALPAFLFIVFDRHSCEKKGAQLALNVESLKKFSFVALPVMIIIILSGLILTDRMVGDCYHALVASTYGWSLIIKVSLLIIILIIAFQARSKWLPLFAQVCDTDNHSNVEQKDYHLDRDTPFVGVKKLRKWIRIEFLFALLLVLFATILSNAVPAKHAVIENWPYSFRFTIDGTLGAGSWEEPGTQFFLALGIILLITAVGLFLLAVRQDKSFRKYKIAALASLLACLVITLTQVAVEAYPETYRDSPVPFDAISISNGSAHFSEFCANCHGSQGAGNGILAKTLPIIPTDLLTDLYTARRTNGDFFHWISYGIEDAGMPGFSKNLEEEDRWDIVNYVRALSNGYLTRWLGPKVTGHKSLLVVPDFQFTTYAGVTSTLKEYQQSKNVILVFFSLPSSLERLQVLNKNYEKFKNSNTVILAVPLDKQSETDIASFAENSSLEVVREGWSEIKDSYILYRRTLKDPDTLGKGDIPNHMEFMVDQSGYLRARWIPALDQSGWDNLALLANQLQQLNKEKEILPQSHNHAQ